MREVRRLVELHQAGIRDYSPILWALLMFDGACQRLLDVPMPRVAAERGRAVRVAVAARPA
jgi:hypothetical protein